MNLSKIGRLLFPSKKPADAEPKYSQSPNPEEMFKSGLPEKTYQGMKVEWDLTVQNMHGEINRNEILVLTSYQKHPGNIWLTIDTEKYPDIYYCASGSKIIMRGEVTSVQGNDIYIKNCQIAREKSPKTA